LQIGRGIEVVSLCVVYRWCVFAAAAVLSVGIGQALNLAMAVQAPVRVEMRMPMSFAKSLRDAPSVVDERARPASVKATAVIASPSRHRRVGTKCNVPSVKPLDSVGFHVTGNGSAPRLGLQSNLPKSASLAVAQGHRDLEVSTGLPSPGTAPCEHHARRTQPVTAMLRLQCMSCYLHTEAAETAGGGWPPSYSCSRLCHLAVHYHVKAL
jgi:hypothetical protein